MDKGEAAARDLLTLAQTKNLTLREVPEHELNDLVGKEFSSRDHQGFVLRAEYVNMLISYVHMKNNLKE
jgi:hypothetical protein